MEILEPETEKGVYREATPVTALPEIGEKRAALLARLGIQTIYDLLHHAPRRYIDRTQVTPVADAKPGEEKQTFFVRVVRASRTGIRGRWSKTELVVADETGKMRVIFHGRGYLARSFLPNTRLLLTGTPAVDQSTPVLPDPEYEDMGEAAGGVEEINGLPVYPSAAGLSQRNLRRWIRTALAGVDYEPDPIPEVLRHRHGLIERRDAFRQLHFPFRREEAEEARKRFAYEELFCLLHAIALERQHRLQQEKGIAHRVEGPILSAFQASLPFPLTAEQQRVIRDLLADMAKPWPMARLIQGDVGCGKTVVAAHGIAAALDGGYQVAFMVPTEVLAEQHAETLRRYFLPHRVNVYLLTAGVRDAADVRRAIQQDEPCVVVGTHALIQETTLFANLGLVVIDEQHRFGVGQRERLVRKGTYPDVLHLTATPIPRSMALTVFGALDISVIGELPPGRMPVATECVASDRWPELYRRIRREAQERRQTYVICPQIGEEGSAARGSAVALYEQLKKLGSAELRVALLHGRLPSAEKSKILHAFRRGDIDVLVSTTVVEVGVDAPCASLIIIHEAQRFGLVPLHQLRGRVGRNSEPGTCVLVVDENTITAEARRRLEMLCRCQDGLAIAQADLELRGPGEVYGFRQAGWLGFRYADVVRDIARIEAIQQDVQECLHNANREALASNTHGLRTIP